MAEHEERTMKRRSRGAWRLVAALSLAFGGLVLPAAPANAGGSCSFGCSETHNISPYGVLAGRDWCTDSICPGSQTMSIYTGGKTPQNEDWDGFRVDAGWCYTVQWWVYGLPAEDLVHYDQRGRGSRWIQVHNYETAVVIRQSTGACL
ncbi:hypothetical protein [Actinomadura sp. HBU206391]|uniref:hypothetical protein n=1 Tax=Actinomadura sp. HBU206391 TaxID=2731692 RepID=UPI0016509F0D|nr:hypothetical protein [Actinomadura sp. HBU206391]MBC6457069.1 hypothetical protein [Actinomadura sp. HBU206391]